jgi:DNA replication and repair protein RecF
VLGDNGEGKTNILEAISYLCLTKSFYAAGDAVVVRFDEGMFEVEGIFHSDHGSDSTVRVAFENVPGKKVVSLNRRPVEPFLEMIGKFPVVICSPEHSPITQGGPAERRTFVDFVISQSSSVYFETLLEYRKALKHRNKVLLDARISGVFDPALIEPWDEHIIRLGAVLMARRASFSREFQPYVVSAYGELLEGGEEPEFEYRAHGAAGTETGEEDFRGVITATLRTKAREERKFGTTLAGPHRDEFHLTINDLDIRKYASQGQHKTFLVSLKLAEFEYLRERCRETPLLLLDDVFSELDGTRAERLLRHVGQVSQTFITSTVTGLFDRALEFGETNRKFYIRGGSVVPAPESIAS